MDNKTAKDHLDTVIRKARVHFYKPIQIAEILHRDRVGKDIDLDDKDTQKRSLQQRRRWVLRNVLYSRMSVVPPQGIISNQLSAIG